MKTNNKSKAKLGLVMTLCVITISGCARKKGDDDISSLDDDAVEYVVESSVGSVNQALNDSEQTASYADSGLDKKGRISEFLGSFGIAEAQAASCSLSRFSPSMGSGSCAGTALNKTITSILNGCTAGPSDEFVLRGSVTLTFDSASTCDTWIGASLPNSGSVTRTTTDFLRLNPNGSSVSTSSAQHTNYLGLSIGGGVKTDFQMGSRSITILGLQKKRTRANGTPGFDHSVTTSTPLVVTGTKVLGNRNIQSGSIRVDHNRLKYSTTTSFAGLAWTSNCCHPSSGTLTFQLVGAESGSLVANFGTGVCGRVTLTRDGVSRSLDLNSCE